MTRKTVVLVCMVDSIHVARWIAQFDPKEVKFILFPSGPNRRVHPKILEMIERGKQFDNQMTLVPFGGRLSLPLWALDRFFSDRIRGLLLRRTLKKIQPDFVHALEFQHAGYVTIRALEDTTIRTPFIATNYGSDIYWFQRYPRHKAKVQRILERADGYSAECRRDYLLAKKLGFAGLDLPLGPNAGGVRVAEPSFEFQAPSRRKTIAIKGYHGWVGRAIVALDALEKLKQELEDYEIIIYSANLRVVWRARGLRQRTGLNLTIHRKGSLSHEQIMEMFMKSRIYVGISLSDGIGTSLLEAMSVGAFPIQTSTGCADEWIVDGQTGFLITDVAEGPITSALALALRADQLVDNAQRLNMIKIKEKADPNLLALQAGNFYALDSTSVDTAT